MEFNYQFTAATERKIRSALKRFIANTTVEIIATATENAITDCKNDLTAKAELNRRPASVTLIAERAYVRVLANMQNVRKLTAAEMLSILSIVQCQYHDGGKIEGVQSIDSTSACDFCERMANSKNANCVCKGCYARKEAQFKTYVKDRHGLTAYILSTFEFTVDQLKHLPLYTPAVRFNEDGDTINEIHADNYHKIALAFPHIHFGYWFKNVKAVAAGVAKYGKLENVSYIYSEPMINGGKATAYILRKYDFIDYVFTVYSNKTNTIKAINSGAGVCNGKKCADCGYKCYYKTHNALLIAEILRK